MVLDNTPGRGGSWSPTTLETQTIAALNDRIAFDPDVVAVVLTVRDGVTLVRRR